MLLQLSNSLIDVIEPTSDADIYRYPDRYRDKERGGKFWDKVMGLLPDPDAD